MLPELTKRISDDVQLDSSMYQQKWSFFFVELIVGVLKICSNFADEKKLIL